MRNAGLDEAQAGIKILGRNISDFRYAHDTTLMAKKKKKKERKKERKKRKGQKYLLMKVKRE